MTTPYASSANAPHDGGADTRALRPSLALRCMCAALFAIGGIARVWPFFDGPSRYLQRFPTEDGYFMLTIGRNLAIGKGFSTADGTMLTNGTQPLTTFLWAACFRLVSGDRGWGVALVLLLELVVASCATYALYRFTRVALGARRAGPSIALLASALWWASSLNIPHTMNCLETGTYVLVLLVLVHVLARVPASRRWTLSQAMRFGLLAGVLFLVRNDAVFVIAAACLAHLSRGLPLGVSELRARLRDTLVFGTTSIVVASPWLYYNYSVFGHIVPISGLAERLSARFGGNLPSVITVLAEYLSAFLPIPQSIQAEPAAVAFCSAMLVVAAWVTASVVRRANSHERWLMSFVGLFALPLIVYYGCFFGADWFVARYLFPLSPFFAILAVVVLLWLADQLRAHGLGALAVVGGVLIAATVFGVNARNQLSARDHQHFQVVRWVKRHVPESTWVGAIQTGTLGFYHDRTINLDGKVNLAAYDALVNHTRGRYVASLPVQYLVDWAGMADWMTIPEVRESFDVLIRDEGLQLGVLRRKH